MKWGGKMGQTVMQSCSNTAINLHSLESEALAQAVLEAFKKWQKERSESREQVTLRKYSTLLSWLQKSCLFRLFWIWNSVSYKNWKLLSRHLYKCLLKHRTNFPSHSFPTWSDCGRHFSFFWANVLQFCPSKNFIWHPALNINFEML